MFVKVAVLLLPLAFHCVASKSTMEENAETDIECVLILCPYLTIGQSCSEANSVRLYPNYGSYGPLQVCYSGYWRTVCEYGWGYEEAKVACNQLGLTGGCCEFFIFVMRVAINACTLKTRRCMFEHTKYREREFVASLVATWPDYACHARICKHKPEKVSETK